MMNNLDNMNLPDPGRKKGIIKRVIIGGAVVTLLIVGGLVLALNPGKNSNNNSDTNISEDKDKDNKEKDDKKQDKESKEDEDSDKPGSEEEVDVDMTVLDESIAIVRVYPVSGSDEHLENGYIIYLSPDTVASGLNIGDLWAVVGDGPVTMDNAIMIQTFDPATMGTVEELSNGGRLVTWETELYLMDGSVSTGDKVTVGVNLAGQDKNGQWIEEDISPYQLTVDWGSNMFEAKMLMQALIKIGAHLP